MAENIVITATTRESRYKELQPQLSALLSGEQDLIANMANIAAALKTTFGFFWVGFYLVKGEDLVLGPFQGPVACTRIARGKGVCGAAWEKRETTIVPDVDKFPGHIACSSESRSEIVVPLKDQANRVWAVLDLDSDKPDDFSETDARFLEEICRLLRPQN
jgi:L-methionine (R)-S-oxide reductase